MHATPINLEHLAELRATMPLSVGQRIDDYLRTTPTLLASLRLAVAAPSWGAIAFLTHRIQGTSAVFGASTLVGLCEAWTQATDLASWLATLEAEYARVAAALEQDQQAHGA